MNPTDVALLLTVATMAAIALALVLWWRGRGWLCWLLGHEVGVARLERVRLAVGEQQIRTSRCVRCNMPFRG